MGWPIFFEIGIQNQTAVCLLSALTISDWNLVSFLEAIIPLRGHYHH